MSRSGAQAQVYVQPITLAQSPQSLEGEAIRLGGSLVWAGQFALIRRDGGQRVQRIVCSMAELGPHIAALPDALRDLAEAQLAGLKASHPPLALALRGGGTRSIRLDQPQVMGILNVTPDSFSDGGEFMDDPAIANAHAAAMLEAGAAIIDVGGESTRPGAAATWEGDELKRVLPAVELLAASGAAISVDTRRAAVMEASLAAGAQVINDVSALRHDPRALELVRDAGCPVVIMHAPGSGENLHANDGYADVLLDVFDWLEERRNALVAAGIARDRIILDPGIGFGKSLSDNLSLLNGMPLFHALGQPLLAGVSRKRMIGALSNEAPAHQRLGGSILLAGRLMDAGVHLLRVHDVAETVQAAHVWRGLRDAALTDFAGITR